MFGEEAPKSTIFTISSLADRLQKVVSAEAAARLTLTAASNQIQTLFRTAASKKNKREDSTNANNNVTSGV